MIMPGNFLLIMYFFINSSLSVVGIFFIRCYHYLFIELLKNLMPSNLFSGALFILANILSNNK